MTLYNIRQGACRAGATRRGWLRSIVYKT